MQVGAATYDVVFVDGSCPTLFDTCGSFAFGTQAAALDAAQALLDQVFVGAFDDDPRLTTGCGAPTAFRSATTPYEAFSNPSGIDQVRVAYATNFGSGLGAPADGTSLLVLNAGFGTGIDLSNTYAVWTAGAVAPVPEPGSLALLVAAGLAGVRSRRRHRRA